MVENLAHSTPQGLEVLALYGDDLEAVARKRLGDIVSLEVLRGMSRDGHIVVINEELDVEVLRDGKARSLCVVSFLLRSVRAEHEDRLVLVSHRDTVDPWPDVPETSGGELDSGGQPQFGVAWELRVGFAIVQKVLGGDVTLDSRHQVLGGDTVPYRNVRQLLRAELARKHSP